MLDILWRVLEIIIDTHLNACINFHEVLHGLCAVILMGMTILELKLTQELAIIDQYPLLLLFLDLCKSYETLDRGHLLTTLERYGAGPQMCGILEKLWEWQEVITRENG